MTIFSANTGSFEQLTVTNTVTASAFKGDGSNVTGVVTANTASYVTYTNIDGKPTLVSSSGQVNVFNAVGGDSLATTGSNTFTAPQTISDTTNSTSYLDGALHIAGGMSVRKDIRVSGSMTINGLLTVVSMSSQYVTSSQYNLGVSKITVNDDDNVRFAGFSVYDSGSSSPATASIYWDSLKHKFIYENLSGSAYNSALFIAGPKNTGSLGDEVGLTSGYIPYATGDDHISDSVMFQSGSSIGIRTTTPVAPLQVGNATTAISAAARFTTNTGGVPELLIIENAANRNADRGSQISFYNPNGTGTSQLAAAIFSANETSSPSGPEYLGFKTGTGGTISEKLRITSTGNVGIGTTTPRSLLHTTGVMTSTGETGIPTTGTGIEVSYQTPNARGRIIAFDRDASVYKPLILNDGALYISASSSGPVGIGTTNPNEKLEVYGVGNFGIRIANSGNTNNDYSALRFYQAGVEKGIIYTNAENVYFGAGGNPRLMISGSGNVGINSVAPKARLDVVGTQLSGTPTISSVPNVRISNGNTVSTWFGGDDYIYTWIQAIQDDGTNNIKSLVLQPINGNVGIGLNPQYKLDVSGSGRFVGNEPIVTNATTGNYSVIAHQYNGVTRAFSGYNSGFAIYGGEANTNTRIQAGGAYVMTLLSGSGNTGIGTTNPQVRLHVYDSVNAESARFDSNNGQGGYIVFTDPINSNATRGFVGYGPTLFTSMGISDFGIRSQAGIVLGTQGFANFYLNSSGNVGIGITTPSAPIEIYRDGGNENTTGGGINLLRYYFNGSYRGSSIYHRYVSGGANDSMIFAVSDDGNPYASGTNATTYAKMILTIGGNLGIGTLAPEKRLHVFGDALIGGSTATSTRALSIETNDASSYPIVIFRNHNATATAGNYISSLVTKDGANDEPAMVFAIGTVAGGALSNRGFTFQNYATPLVRITPSGNVGVGTTNPTTRLEVMGNDTSGNRQSTLNVLTVAAENPNSPFTGFGGAIVFKNRRYFGSFDNVARIVTTNLDDSISNLGTSLGFDVTPTTGSALTRAMTITPAGNLGIGITTATRKLEVNGPLGLPYAAMGSSRTAGDFTITVSGLGTLTNSVWRSAALLVFYNGVDTDQSNQIELLTYIRLRGLATWGATVVGNIVGTATISTTSETSTSISIIFDVPNNNFGSVYAVLIGGYTGEQPSISIAE